SMNAQNRDVYIQHCRPKVTYSYEYMLEFVRKLRSKMGGVSVTAIDGLKGVDIQQCQKIAETMQVNFRTRTLGIVG
ncbi:MAG: radical SAM protein, partial [Gammaproteobacteria bacterium]|nr:radical SAM protein [Gammaproteobacteria bacterium]